MVAAFAHALRTGASPQIHGDGRQTRDFVYVDDAVDALVPGRRAAAGWSSTSARDQHADPRSVGDDRRPRRAGTRRRTATAHDIGWFALSPTRARIHLAWAPWTELGVGLRSLG